MNNKTANLTLGTIAIVADLLGIAGFILSGDVSKFWSATWMVYVLGLSLLMGIGFLFFSKTEDDNVKTFYPIAGGIYALLSCLAIFGLFAGLSGSDFGIRAFFGMIVLAVFPAAMALLICLLCANQETIARTISYFYATAGIFAVIYLLIRYSHEPGYSWALAGEMFGLILIGVGFTVFAFSVEA